MGTRSFFRKENASTQCVRCDKTQKQKAIEDFSRLSVKKVAIRRVEESLVPPPDNNGGKPEEKNLISP